MRTKSDIDVAFDTAALHERYRNHGIQVYTRQLLSNLAVTGPNRGLAIHPFTLRREDLLQARISNVEALIPVLTSLLKHDRCWRYGGATARALLAGADVLFLPGGTTLPIPGLLPSVTTIHDLTPVVMPLFDSRTTRSLERSLRLAARLSTAIITVSECSRRDIVNICGVPETKVTVIYEGHDETLFNELPTEDGQQKPLFARLGLARPYIFHHGALQPRKNLVRLIHAFQALMSSGPDLGIDLVLAGSRGWQYQEILSAAESCSTAAGRVIITGPLSDSELAIVLKGATLVVIPSLYEGFCLPMIEAMACGIPTVASNTSCLPEVSGGVLRYFDPNSVEEIKSCMESVLRNQQIRTELSRAGQGRAAMFDWLSCAEHTAALLASVAEAGRTKSARKEHA